MEVDSDNAFCGRAPHKLQKCSSQAPNQEHPLGALVKLLEVACSLGRKKRCPVPAVREDKTNGVSVLKKEKVIQQA